MRERERERGRGREREREKGEKEKKERKRKRRERGRGRGEKENQFFFLFFPFPFPFPFPSPCVTAHYIFYRWLPIIIEVLPASLLEQVKKSESDTEFILEILAHLQLIVDSCEQARERPSDYQAQKKFYSGRRAKMPEVAPAF